MMRSLAQAYAARVRPSFGELLAHRLQVLGMTAATFAKRSGISASYLSGVINGHWLPPCMRITRMGRIACNHAQDREDFILSAYLSHSPIAVREEVLRLNHEENGLRAAHNVYPFTVTFPAAGNTCANPSTSIPQWPAPSASLVNIAPSLRFLHAQGAHPRRPRPNGVKIAHKPM